MMMKNDELPSAVFKTILLLALAAGASAFVPSTAKTARRTAPLNVDAIAGIEKRADGMAQVCASRTSSLPLRCMQQRSWIEGAGRPSAAVPALYPVAQAHLAARTLGRGGALVVIVHRELTAALQAAIPCACVSEADTVASRANDTGHPRRTDASLSPVAASASDRSARVETRARDSSATDS